MPTRVKYFVAAVFASALLAFAMVFLRDPRLDVALIGGALGFVLVGGVTQFLAYSLQKSTLGAVSFIPYLVAIVLYPSWVTVALIGTGAALSEFKKNRQAIKRLFNVAQQVLAASIALTVYLLLGGKSLIVDASIKPFAEVGLVATFLTVNTFLVAAVVSISERKNVLKVWNQNVVAGLLYDVIAVPFVHFFALLFVEFQFGGVVFVLVLLLGMRQLYHTRIQLEKYNRELLEVLVMTVEMRDPYTSGHSQRVSKYSRIIARAMSLPSKQVERISIAALLHDVGKIHEIFAGILSKPGKLTPEEFAIMELHPIKSVELVEKVTELEDILPSIRHHHERWDGKGYPDRIAGNAIPLGARIITFADTIDAMMTDRPYRKALGEPEVRAELIKMRGKQFDPDICDALLASPLYPLLFTGEDSRGTPSITQIFDFSRRKRTPAVA